MKRSSLTPIVLGLTWMVSLGVVFALGILSTLAFHVAPEASDESTLSLTEREVAAVFEQLVGEPLDWAALRSYSPRDRQPRQVDLLWRALGEVESAEERHALTRRFFRELGAIKTGVMVERQSTEASASPVRFGALWAAWHDRDPETAVAFRAAMIESGEISAEVFPPLR